MNSGFNVNFYLTFRFYFVNKKENEGCAGELEIINVLWSILFN